MNIKTDLHCHTIASDHAYSTVMELAIEAKQKDLELIAITDHAPVLGDAPMEWHFSCQNLIPREVGGVTILRGAEVNIINEDGEIDLKEGVLKRLDLVIASVHPPCLKPFEEEKNTDIFIKAMENKYVDIAGHCDRSFFPINHERFVKAVGDMGKLIEINAHSLDYKENAENCRKVALMCKKHRVPVVVSSDAHFCMTVGDFKKAEEMLSEIDFPTELIYNISGKDVIDYLERTKNIKIL